MQVGNRTERLTLAINLTVQNAVHCSLGRPELLGNASFTPTRGGLNLAKEGANVHVHVHESNIYMHGYTVKPWTEVLLRSEYTRPYS